MSWVFIAAVEETSAARSWRVKDASVTVLSRISASMAVWKLVNGAVMSAQAYSLPKSSVSDSFKWLASSAKERAKYSAVLSLERWWNESAQLSLWVFPPMQ
jgi:hypothetical protein